MAENSIESWFSIPNALAQIDLQQGDFLQDPEVSITEIPEDPFSNDNIISKNSRELDFLPVFDTKFHPEYLAELWSSADQN
jgi:hypothetical protein